MEPTLDAYAALRSSETALVILEHAPIRSDETTGYAAAPGPTGHAQPGGRR